MIRINQKDFLSLKGNKSYDGLYDHLMHVSRNGKGDIRWSPTDRTVYIKDETLGTAFRNLLAEWVRNNNVEVVQVPNEPASDPELDALQPRDPPLQPAKPAVTKATIDATKQNLKDLKETESRYKYWVQGGLLNTVENGTLIDAWMSTHETSYTPAGLDRCIAACRASLQWYVAPVIERLPNGDERMPLTARPSARWTKAQLQDWDARRLAALSAERRKKNAELAKSLAV